MMVESGREVIHGDLGMMFSEFIVATLCKVHFVPKTKTIKLPAQGHSLRWVFQLDVREFLHDLC